MKTGGVRNKYNVIWGQYRACLHFFHQQLYERCFLKPPIFNCADMSTFRGTYLLSVLLH